MHTTLVSAPPCTCMTQLRGLSHLVRAYPFLGVSARSRKRLATTINARNILSYALPPVLTRNADAHSCEKVGTVTAEDFMDDGTPIRLAVTIDRASRSALFDFAGTVRSCCKLHVITGTSRTTKNSRFVQQVPITNHYMFMYTPCLRARKSSETSTLHPR